MTSTDEQSFLKAIHESPDDDTPRLVFADWLDERGTDDDKARAALIRAQCRLEHLAPGSKERKRLEREAKAIIKANEKQWLKGIRTSGLGAHTLTFRRGFLDGLSMSPTTFVKRGKELFQLVPTLRSVVFPNAANEVTELAESPFLARVASVDLTRMCTCGYCAIDIELRDLFKSKHVKNLRSLNVSRDRIDAAVAGALARSPNLANLASLDLSNNPLDGPGLAALGKSKHLRKLETLVLTQVAGVGASDEGAAGFQEFAKSKHFVSLTRLELSGNNINAEGVKALVAAPFFGQLTRLDLSHNRIGEQGAKALVGADTASLEHLDLSWNHLGQRALGWLKAKFGKRLKV